MPQTVGWTAIIGVHETNRICNTKVAYDVLSSAIQLNPLLLLRYYNDIKEQRLITRQFLLLACFHLYLLKFYTGQNIPHATELLDWEQTIPYDPGVYKHNNMYDMYIIKL